jgi:hypothetical protein
MKCGVAGWAGVVLGIVNTAQRESFILTLLEMNTLVTLLEGVCMTPSRTRRLLLCKLFLAVFAMSDLGGDPDNKSNTVSSSLGPQVRGSDIKFMTWTTNSCPWTTNS